MKANKTRLAIAELKEELEVARLVVDYHFGMIGKHEALHEKAMQEAAASGQELSAAERQFLDDTMEGL